MMMLKNVVAVAAILGLTGCYGAMDQASRDQAAAEAQAVTGTQARWVAAMTQSQAVRTQLSQADYAAARTTLQGLYRDLYAVVTAADVTPEIRTRVTRVFPTLITLQSKVEAKDADARILADKLSDTLAETQGYLSASGWLRTGGGAGMAPMDDPERVLEDRKEDRNR